MHFIGVRGRRQKLTEQDYHQYFNNLHNVKVTQPQQLASHHIAIYLTTGKVDFLNQRSTMIFWAEELRDEAT